MRRNDLKFLLAGTLLVAVAAFSTPGCGGDSSAVSGGDDGGGDGDAFVSEGGGDVTMFLDGSPDASTDSAPDSGGQDSAPDSAMMDSAADSAGDAPGDALADAPVEASMDAGMDAAPICPVDNVACSNGGGNGLCKSMACAACVDPSDDANCTTAYGGSTNPFLCLGGSCAPGNCRANTDCVGNANGSLCGVSQTNFCGKCATDAQCVAANPMLPVCNTTTGVCVASAGSCVGLNDSVCTVNPADVCCGLACIPGNCCDAAFCQARLGNVNATCSNHTCTLCDPVVGLTYIVDPLNGVDGTATGSGTAMGGTATPSCAFKTITRALQAIGPSPAVGTIIKVRNTAPVSVAGNGETFPVIVTKNITITATGGLVTVTPPAMPAQSSAAFVFASAASGINGTLGGGSMTIDGAQNTALFGIIGTTGGTDGTTIQNVAVQNFLREGIVVTNAGVLAIRGGVTVTGSGTATARHPGLHVNGTGHVTINVPAGSATTAFNANTQHGILVDGSGSVNIQGVVNAGAATGTIECRGNVVAGIDIAQTPGNVVPANIVTGLLVIGTTNGNGMRIEGGSNVKVRSSYSLGNTGSGIVVATSVIGMTRNNVITNIDLGKVNDFGLNTFQAAVGSNPNQAAGICFQMDATSGTLAAEGNLFGTGKNCSTTAAVLTFNNMNCGGNRDLGLAIARPMGTTTGNDINVLTCTHP